MEQLTASPLLPQFWVLLLKRIYGAGRYIREQTLQNLKKMQIAAELAHAADLSCGA